MKPGALRSPGLFVFKATAFLMLRGPSAFARHSPLAALAAGYRRQPTFRAVLLFFHSAARITRRNSAASFDLCAGPHPRAPASARSAHAARSRRWLVATACFQIDSVSYLLPPTS